MAKRRSGKKIKRGAVLCITRMTERVAIVASIGKTVVTLLQNGEEDDAFHAALDLEPLLHDVNHLIQAACAFQSSGRK